MLNHGARGGKRKTLATERTEKHGEKRASHDGDNEHNAETFPIRMETWIGALSMEVFLVLAALDAGICRSGRNSTRRDWFFVLVRNSQSLRFLEPFWKSRPRPSGFLTGMTE
jgi:hypothetical protein